jgi:hypothetical protein
MAGSRMDGERAIDRLPAKIAVIMPKRDEIVADWRSRLETAAASEGSSSPRSAWLERVRRRLYRFLVSLYGDGNWNTPATFPAPLPASPMPASPARPLPDSNRISDVIPLPGKPARSRNEIGAVLKAVAGARFEPALPGPLLAGHGDDAWLPIASTSCDLDPQQCAAALFAAQIAARIIPRQGDCIVEVRSREFATAQRVLHREMHRLRLPRRSVEQAHLGAAEQFSQSIARLIRQIPPWWRFLFVAVFELALTFPAALFAVTLVSFLHFGPEPKSLALDQGFFEHFWAVWRGLCITMLLIVFAQYQGRLKSGKLAADADLPGG